MALRRRAASDNGRVSPEVLQSGMVAELFPALVEFCCSSEWEEGVSRLTGTILLCVEEGRWRAWMHDRDSKESLWVSGATLDDLLATCDQVLLNGSGEWRKDRGKFSRNAGRGS